MVPSGLSMPSITKPMEWGGLLITVNGHLILVNIPYEMEISVPTYIAESF